MICLLCLQAIIVGFTKFQKYDAAECLKLSNILEKNASFLQKEYLEWQWAAGSRQRAVKAVGSGKNSTAYCFDLFIFSSKASCFGFDHQLIISIHIF